MEKDRYLPSYDSPWLKILTGPEGIWTKDMLLTIYNKVEGFYNGIEKWLLHFSIHGDFALSFNQETLDQ